METELLFLGRQPILNRDEQIMGFELLFRSANSLSADVTDIHQASLDVIYTALSSFGIEDLLGVRKGFFNVNRDVLLSDVMELLPKGQVVVELLETVHVDDAVIARCIELKERGYTFALDDHIYDPSFEPLYAVVDIAKIDILSVASSDLDEMIRKLKNWPITLLAEKVETFEQYERCVKLGFDLFQGFYFARPVVLERRRVDISKITIMKLLNRLLSDADIKEIEDIFKQNPGLTYNLLRLVNSVAFGFKEKISSLRHALMILGQQQLRRWIMLALFASRDAGEVLNPLLELAAQRGRLMELLIQQIPVYTHEKDINDCAFMTGFLSVLDVLFGAPMDEMINQLNLNEDIRLALLNRKGLLGDFLRLVEKLERVDSHGMMPLFAQLGLNLNLLLAAQIKAIHWCNSLHTPS